MSQPRTRTDTLTRIAIGSTAVCDVRDHGVTGDGTTNDRPALQELVDALGAAVADDGRRRVIYCPPGIYLIRSTGIVWRSGVSLIGAGTNATRFVLDNNHDTSKAVALAHFTRTEHGASPDNHLTDCSFSGFEVDGSQVDLPEYNALAKGLGLQYVTRSHFRDLYIHDTVGTGFGCDFLQDCVVDNVVAVRCGREDSGEQKGGAGIGIGIGGWSGLEPVTIVGCTAIGNGTNGIFLELEPKMWPPPRGYRIIGCHVADNRFGISDWGADGLIVSSCTIIGNHEAGFDISAMGTGSVAGRGGLVTNCLIDSNVRDGLGVGNTPGPYTFSGNRISRNGRYGYWQHNVGGGGHQGPAANIVLDGNEIWANALEGIHLDAELIDASLRNNRVRDNGRQSAPGASGGGDTVSYTARTLTDTAANWLPDGHLGKHLTVGRQHVIVIANSATELTLAPVRPGAETSWAEGTPLAGMVYHLPDPPGERPGIALAAPTEQITIRANRVWDSQDPKYQTHGLWITGQSTCRAARVIDNDLEGNGRGPTRFDTAPEGGYWRGNLGT